MDFVNFRESNSIYPTKALPCPQNPTNSGMAPLDFAHQFTKITQSDTDPFRIQVSIVNP